MARHSSSLARLLRRLLPVVPILLALATPVAEAQMSVGRVKGLFIERFTRFIEWPASALPGQSPFQICIQGTGETADDLAGVAVTRRWKGREAVVRRLSGGASPSGCHVLFLAASESGRVTAAVAAATERPILTVSDAPGFADRGVLINLYQEGRFMRFEINISSVRRSPLVFSSQLLRLGRRVGEPSEESAPAAPAAPVGQ